MIWLLVMVIPGDIQRLAYYQDKQECRDAARQTEIAGGHRPGHCRLLRPARR